VRWEQLYKEEQEKLPELYRGQFLYNVSPEEIQDKHPKVKLLFSFRNATEHQKSQLRKKLYLKRWQRHESDTGSDEVQVASLTVKIRNLLLHLRRNKQDKKNIRHLQLLQSRRNGVMKSLKKSNAEKYYKILLDLKLGDIVRAYK